MCIPPIEVETPVNTIGRKQGERRLAFALIAALVVAFPAIMLFREIRHQRFNHELIEAIAHQKNDLALQLLREGADGTAREGETVTVTSVMKQFVSRLFHRPN